jgi:hypothetical protein
MWFEALTSGCLRIRGSDQCLPLTSACLRIFTELMGACAFAQVISASYLRDKTRVVEDGTEQ